jgi:hypothetical protein
VIVENATGIKVFCESSVTNGCYIKSLEIIKEGTIVDDIETPPAMYWI